MRLPTQPAAARGRMPQRHLPPRAQRFGATVENAAAVRSQLLTHQQSATPPRMAQESQRFSSHRRRMPAGRCASPACAMQILPRLPFLHFTFSVPCNIDDSAVQASR
jgi:hypothetical protein